MKIKDLFALCVVMLIVPAFSCKEKKGADVRGITDKEIKIGASFPMTGPGASFGNLFAESTRNYIRYTNDQNGVNGRQLKLIVEDDRYSIPPAIAAFKKLVYKDKVFAFEGPGSASLLNVMWKHIEEEKLPSMTLVMPEIAFSPPRRYIFGVTDTYPGQVKLIVDYMVKDYKLKKPRVALVHPDTEAGKIDLAPALERLKRYNITPITKEVLNPGAVDAVSQVMSIKRHKANAVLHVGTIPSSTITMLRDLRKMGLKIPFFASYGAMAEEKTNAIGEAANQFYSIQATSPWYGKGSGLEEMRRVTLKYHPGTEKPHRGTAYTHFWIINTMLVEALKRAGRDLDEETLIDVLEDIKDYDTRGLCGPISYSSENHRGGNSWKVYKADHINKKYIPVTDWRRAN